MPTPSFKQRVALVVLAWLFTVATGWATTVTISKTPPGVTSRVAPNIVVTFDDSGSMSSTSIPDAMDSYTDRKYYYSATGNAIYFDPNVTYTPPPDASGTALPNATFTAAWRDGYCANILGKTCWSPKQQSYIAPVTVDLSKAFYSTYLTNTLAGNSPCPRNANEAGWYGNDNCAPQPIPQAVRASSANTVISVTTCSLFGCGAYNGKNGTTTVDNGDGTNTTYACTSFIVTNCTITTFRVADTGAFYYVCPAANSENGCVYHVVANESATIQQNFANWYSYYRTRNLNARAAVGRVFSALPDNAVRVTWQTLQSQSGSGSYYTSNTNYKGLAYGLIGTDSQILELANGTSCKTTATTPDCWRSQFMNWVYGVPASGGTPTRAATVVAGEFYKRNLKTSAGAKDPYWNGSANNTGELACRKNFNMVVTDGYWNNDSPSDVSPNASTSTTLPDKTAYSTSDNNSRIYWNQAGTTNPSLADIAFYYWATDLRTDLSDNVPTYFPDLTTGVTGATTTVSASSPGSSGEVYFNPSNDPANWQHMSQYMVTMGISGNLNYPGDYLGLRTGTKQWPKPDTGGGAANIDDTWHAAVNSRGGYFSAADPTSLVTSLSTILSSVIASSSTALTYSLSSTVLTSNAVAFYASYDTTNWTGTLDARSLGTNGTVGASVWPSEAGALLTTRNLGTSPRYVVTSTGPGTGLGTTFAFDNLSTSQQAILNSPDGTGTTSDSLGRQRVDWLNGIRTNEGTTFRTRLSLLGAIFGSQPAYVGAPSGNYSDTFPAGSPEATALASSSSNSYSAFLAKWASRLPVVYVGANDGMLHAFDARTKTASASAGSERWAYVPASVYPNLPAQSKLTNFAFTPTVDGSPVTGDVYFNSANGTKSTGGWHTLLVGSLRYGGRGVFGIDITDTTAATLSSASAVAQKVLWEFNSDTVSTAGTPANLGYTFGTPVITRVGYKNADNSVGRWVVLVPGGYFPDTSTAAAASNTYSSLFVLDAQTGTLLHEYRTPSTIASHGLATPAVGDYEGDQVADVAFAGDLDGNVWRIDLSNASLTSATQSTGVSQLFKPATANAQSVTTAPRLIADPTSSAFIVIFGTGRYLSTADTADTTQQALYGIREPGTAVTTPVAIASLVQQTLVSDATSGGIGVSNNAVPSTKSGWTIPLSLNSGERVVVTPALDSSSNTVSFSTLIPTSSDPCTTSASGSFLSLNGTNGTAAFGVSIGATATFAAGFSLAGSSISGAASSGALNTAASLSGSTSYAPGQINSKTNSTDAAGIPTARRRSWRVLNSEN